MREGSARGTGLIGLIGLVMLVSLSPPSQTLADAPAPDGYPMAALTDPHAGHRTGSGKEINTYSLFMHHAAGVGTILVGLLLLAHRLTGQRFAALRTSIGATWVLLGLFLFIRSDRAGWPIGPNGFLESFTMPTRREWIQHKLLSMIPMFLGIYYGRARAQESTPFWNYAAAAFASLGALALTVHQHMDHPEEMDIVNLQHRFFAVTAFFIAVSLVLDSRQEITWKLKPYLLPSGLLIMGLQLAFYVE